MTRYWSAASDLDWRDSVDPEEPLSMPDPQIADARAAADPLAAAPLVPEGGSQLPSGAPTGRIAAALAKAQLKIRNPAKDRTADIKSEKGRYQYKYSTLADGLDAIRIPLAEQEIAGVQTTGILGDILILKTRLIHSSGESLETEWPVGAYARLTPQAMGSALTYARRYSLYCLVGIAGYDEDDDGAAASSVEPPFVMGPEEIVYIETLIRDTGSDLDKFLEWINRGQAVHAASIADLNADQYKRALDNLNRKKRSAAGGSAQ